MKHTYQTRWAGYDEVPNLVEWTHANREKNRYDPDIFKYESTRVLAVDRDGSPQAYLPYQLVIMTESLAPRPGRTLREIAVALREAIRSVVRIARKSKIGEIYFLATDDETAEFAKAHGYEELHSVRVMRLKPEKVSLPEDGME